LIDTAEHYGLNGLSESLFGDLVMKRLKREEHDRMVIATKFLPTPWRHPWMYPGVMVESFAGSLSRLRLGDIDIWQLHGPGKSSHLWNRWFLAEDVYAV
jgi:aryl-alcohol dehydrogenase-like predicted oxidoreductase